MNYWLNFRQKTIQNHYDEYSTRNTKIQFQYLTYFILSFGFINLFTIIVQHYLSRIEYHLTQFWFLSNLIQIFISTMVLAIFMKILSKLRSITPNNMEMFKFMAFMSFQIVFDNQLFIKDSSELQGYQLYWRGYETQLYTMGLCLFFNKWMTKILYYFCLTLYFGCIKANTYDDHILNFQGLALGVVLAFIIHFGEKISRENFFDFDQILEKEKMWQNLINYLPEDIVIIDQKNHIKYQKKSLNEERKILVGNFSNEKLNLNNFEMSQKFIKRLDNLLLRDSLEDLKKNYMNSISLSIYEQELTEKKNQNLSKNEALDLLIEKFINKSHTLENVLQILNYHLNTLINTKLQLTFDGVFDDKSIELKIYLTEFEHENCFIMIISDATQHNIIMKSHRNDIFDFEADSKLSPVNYGLGLRPSQKIVRILSTSDIDNGIKIKSEVNKGSSFLFTDDEKEILMESNDSKIPNMAQSKIEDPVLSQQQNESTYSQNKFNKNNTAKEEEKENVVVNIASNGNTTNNYEDEINRKICLTSEGLLSSLRENNKIESKSINMLLIAERDNSKNNQLRGDLNQLNVKYEIVNSVEENIEKVNMSIRQHDFIDIIMNIDKKA